MAEPAVSEINVVTTRRILPGLTDQYFKAGPIMAYLRRNRFKPWTGSDTIQDNYIYAPMKSDAYVKGQKFNIDKKRTRAALTFNPKYYYTNVTEYLEDIEVEQKGPTAVFSVVRADLSVAAMSLSAKLEIALYQSGQGARSAHVNGIPEALSDGVIASWDGTVYSSYGGEVRATVSPALNSPTGLISSPNISGPFTYRVAEQSYQSCCIGEEAPVMGITTNVAFGYICENWHPQRVIDTLEPTIGYSGIKFKKATILTSNYAPGAYGTNDPDLGNYYLAGGETFTWLNPGGEGDDAYVMLHISNSPKYSFGFTGFKGEIDSTIVAGQILFAGNVTFRAPRLSRTLYNITG